MNQPLRVLSVQHYPVFGGPHNEVVKLNPYLQELGIETLVALTDQRGNAHERLEGRARVRTLRLNRIRQTLNPVVHASTAAAVLPDVARLRRLVREEAIDIVKVHGPHNPHGALAARLEGVPLVWVVSSTRVPRGFRTIGGQLVRLMADAVLVDGRALVKEYPGLSACAARTVVYYPPVPTGIFVPSPDARARTRSEFAIPDDAPVVGMVANLNPQKGVEYFVRAAAIVASCLPEAHFLHVGGEYETQRRYAQLVRSQLDRSGIPPGRFHFAGERSDVQEIYPAMDVKLITSVPRSEGTTTTAMEAMSCGVPVVATDVGAVSEVVEHGSTGLVVPPLDPAAIAAATLRLLQDDDLRRAMGVKGRERAIERFDVRVCARTHLRAYELALAHHRERQAGRSRAA